VTLPALVFKLVSDPLQHGGLGIARSLGRLGVPVHTLYRDRRTPASRSRYAAGNHWIDAGVEEPDRVLEALSRLSRVVGEAVLIPIDDVAASFVDRHRLALGSGFRIPEQPSGLAEQLSDKRLLTELCARTGTPAPEARFPTTKQQFLQGASELGYPVVVKSMDPVLLRARPNAASVAIAEDSATAERVYDTMEDPARPNLMLQRFIPGGARSVWMFNGYFDADARCRFGLTGRKIRQSPPETGATSLGVCVDNPAVREMAIRFLEQIGYRGIVDMGFRYDRRDGTYRLLDVNPRIGSSFRLFVDGDGNDVVRVLYRDLAGSPPHPAGTRISRRWMVENQDLATATKLMWRRRLGVAAWIRSLRDVDELAWFAADDPAPFGAMIAGTARDLVQRTLRRALRKC
jgi:predicted ATP-grasp superfamily ATP-dependent carboligase